MESRKVETKHNQVDVLLLASITSNMIDELPSEIDAALQVPEMSLPKSKL